MAKSSITLGSIIHWKNQWVSGTVYKQLAVVFHNGSAYLCTTAGTQTEPSFTYDPNTGTYTVSEGWALLAVGVGTETVTGKADIADLLNGVIVPALAANLESWAERDSLSVQDTFAALVRTSAGDTSIQSDVAAKLVSIAAKTNFSAAAFKTSGFNLLHGATAVGAGYYFIVPALPFGTFGTATNPNGLLFTDNNGNNLKPTVRFKALSAGAPTSVNDGVVCEYTDSNGYRFYNPAEAGYIIVSGITLANTCAHIGWSRRYDEFVSPTAAADAGDSVALTSIINAVHSFGKLCVVGSVADRIDFGASSATWHRRIDRVQPTWNTSQNEDGSYLHTATIAAMKSGGVAECGSLVLHVDGTSVSYTDSSASATSDYVYFELATEATGTVSIDSSVDIEDWGIEYLQGADGEAYVTVQYAQSYPDSVAAFIGGGFNVLSSAVAQLIATLFARIEALEDKVKNGFGKLIVEDLEVRHAIDDFSTEGNGNLSGEGAPAVIPDKVGQRYFDKTNSVWYTATGNSAVSNWKLDTNA